MSVYRDVDVDEPSPDESGAYNLWCGVLDQLLRDAHSYWRGAGCTSAEAGYEREQAFDDVMRCGPMTRHVCDRLRIDAEALTEAFIRQLEDMT